jgi:hypothetical protein
LSFGSNEFRTVWFRFAILSFKFSSPTIGKILELKYKKSPELTAGVSVGEFKFRVTNIS